MDGHGRLDTEELEAAALRTLLSRRRDGKFIDAEQMDARLAAMIADKRGAMICTESGREA